MSVAGSGSAYPVPPPHPRQNQGRDAAPALTVIGPARHAAEAAARPETAVLPLPRSDARIGRYTPATEWIKGALDRALAAIGLIVLSPVLAAITIAVRLDSQGPAIFRQQRLGRGGRPFTFYKFRGMYVDARERFPELYEYNYTSEQIRNLHFHSQHDPRITRIGRFLRRTSLDELPNIINVLLGQMSLVGPRPEIPEMIRYYGPSAAAVLSVKPGVTSLAKLIGRDNINFTETLELDVQYVRTRSLALDLRVLFGTAWMVVTGRNIGF